MQGIHWNHLAVLRSASNCRVWKCEQSAARNGRSIRICGFKSARILPVPKENPTQAPDFSHFNEELIQREITLAGDVLQLLKVDGLLYILVELLWPFKLIELGIFVRWELDLLNFLATWLISYWPRLKHNWNTTSILHWSQCHGYVSGQLKESERQSGDFYVEDMKSNESKPLSWERQTVLCWKYFKTKTWYWEILWDNVWIIRGLVFGAALSNFLFAAQTSNCFGCFCHPATSAHNNPHCPQQAPLLSSSLSLTLFCCKLS